MSLIWQCDDRCGKTEKSYTLPEGWEADPVHNASGKFLGMRHTCPKCAETRRMKMRASEDGVQGK